MSYVADHIVARFNNVREDWPSFNACQRNTRKTAKVMGYSSQEYDHAVDYLLTNRLLRW